VSVTDEDGRQSFNWNPGETVRVSSLHEAQLG
jgi:hypothetical protein